MDKKLRAGHAKQDEKIQRLEDEIFTRQTGPPSPPSFVKDAEEISKGRVFLHFVYKVQKFL